MGASKTSRLGHVLLGVVTAWALAVACGGSKNGGDGAGVPDASADPGSRLTPQSIVGDDGSKQFLRWYDTARNEPCVYTHPVDGKSYCLPSPVTYLKGTGSSSTAYSDSACQNATLILIQSSDLGGCSEPPKYVTESSLASCSASPKLQSITASTGTVYWQDGSGCNPMPAGSGFTAFTLGDVVGLDAFVSASIQ